MCTLQYALYSYVHANFCILFFEQSHQARHLLLNNRAQIARCLNIILRHSFTCADDDCVCREHEMPSDLSTAVLFDEQGGHKCSTAVLRLFPYMGFPYSLLGRVAMFIPGCIRDWAYESFAVRRGAIWKQVKRITGLGNTQLLAHKERILGLEEPIDTAWGFGSSDGDV